MNTFERLVLRALAILMLRCTLPPERTDISRQASAWREEAADALRGTDAGTMLRDALLLLCEFERSGGLGLDRHERIRALLKRAGVSAR